MSQVPINAAHSGSLGAGSNFSLPGSVTAGNVVYGIVRWNDATVTGTTVSSNIDGSFTAIGTPLQVPNASGELYLRFYRKNSAGGPCTITIDNTGHTAAFRATFFEIPGCDPTAPLDVSAQAASAVAGTAASSGTTATRAQANSVGIVGCCADAGVTWTAGAGFTLIDANGDVAEQAGYQVFSSTGTDAGTMTLTSAQWGCSMDVFKAASAGGGTWGAQLADRHNRIVQGA